MTKEQAKEAWRKTTKELGYIDISDWEDKPHEDPSKADGCNWGDCFEVLWKHLESSVDKNPP